MKKNFLYKYREIKEKREAYMQEMLLFSSTISDLYKETSDAVNGKDLENRLVVKKTLSGLLKQSFFHGASRFGATNFIA